MPGLQARPLSVANKPRRALPAGLHQELTTTVAVEVTFLENVLPFREYKAEKFPTSLLWGAESSLAPDDPTLGRLDVNLEQASKAPAQKRRQEPRVTSPCPRTS